MQQISPEQTRRLLDRLQNPPAGGNAAFCNSVAENVRATVQKSFCFPCANTPGTVHMAVAAYATASSVRSRVVPAADVALVAAALTAALPEYVEATVTGTVDVSADLTIRLQLPGFGAGGWIDAAPWPSVLGINPARIYTTVTSVTSTTAMRIESMAAPQIGCSVCWVDRQTYALHTARVLTSSTALAPVGTLRGLYDVTLDAPFVSGSGVSIGVGDMVFPAAVNTQKYATALLTAFANLGPYEKQLSLGLLPHSYRLPRNYEQYDYTLGGKFLKALTDSGSEVLDAQWGYQNGGVTVPSLPTNIALGPNIFVPHAIAFYPA